MTIDLRRLLASLLLAITTTGCSGRPARVEPPDIDAASAGTAAVAAYDADGDGAIAGSELERAAPLKSSLDTVDTNKDGKVTAEEITQRIEVWQTSRVGVLPLVSHVTLDGHPLDEATVTLVPAPFLGSNLKPATGVTDAIGMTSLTIDEEFRVAPDVTGVQCGWYQVRISKQQDGQEMLASRYNSETTLGCEVAPDRSIVIKGLRMALTSRR